MNTPSGRRWTNGRHERRSEGAKVLVQMGHDARQNDSGRDDTRERARCGVDEPGLGRSAANREEDRPRGEDDDGEYDGERKHGTSGW
jgi:hypothetical protein